MAQYDRPPRKKPPKPDEFFSTMDHLVRYFTVHQKKLYLLILIFVVGFAGYGVYRIQLSRKLTKLATSYAEAQDAPEDDTLAGWEKVLKENPPKNLRELVHLQIGGRYGSKGQWAEAAQAFQKAAESRSKILHPVAQLALAVSLENSGEFAKAQAAYEAVAKLEKNPLSYDGRLGAARALIGQNKINDAETILFQLLAKDAETPPAVKQAALNALTVLKIKSTTSTVNP